MKPLPFNPALYAVTDGVKNLEAAIKGGATLVQLRCKNLPADEFISRAEEVKKITSRYKVPLIINDNLEVALRVNAEGLHAGQSDITAREARKMLGPRKILGISVFNKKEALEAQAAGADYLGAGAVFPTPSKGDAQNISMGVLKEICSTVKIPVVAIGGINANNIARLEGAGLSGIAVISSLFGTKDVYTAAKELRFEIMKVISDCIIFDFDGTLIDSMPVWKNLAKDYLAGKNITPGPVLYEELEYLTLPEAALHLKNKYPLADGAEEIEKELSHLLTEGYKKYSLFKPGARELLEKLQSQNKKMVIATGALKEPVTAVLKRLKAREFFTNIITTRDAGASKDSPAVFLAALKAAGGVKEKSILAEDNLTALQTAKKAGFYAVGVYDSNVNDVNDDKQQMLESADFYLNSLEEWK
ncbi:MAG: thiamine phosphate synthase [Elusimicrobiota bacterium]|nr:thiamine phosphate synthase [Elusimicrobiota bacterium]